jgi:hypothetical protein
MSEKDFKKEVEEESVCHCGCSHDCDEESCCEGDERGYEGEENDLFVFSFRDDNDQEIYFARLDEFLFNEKEYWICQKVDIEAVDKDFEFDEENSEIYVFIAEDEEGETVLTELDSEEELEKVVEEWQKSIEESFPSEEEEVLEEE